MDHRNRARGPNILSVICRYDMKGAITLGSLYSIIQD